MRRCILHLQSFVRSDGFSFSYSHSQIRGSIPLEWSQTPTLKYSPSIRVFGVLLFSLSHLIACRIDPSSISTSIISSIATAPSSSSISSTRKATSSCSDWSTSAPAPPSPFSLFGENNAQPDETPVGVLLVRFPRGVQAFPVRPTCEAFRFDAGMRSQWRVETWKA